MSRALAAVATALVALVALIGYAQIRQTPETAISADLFTPVERTVQPGGDPVVIEVVEGETAAEIGDDLEQAGVIESSRLFRTIVALTGVGDHLGAGEYEFQPGQTVVSVIEQIRSGRTTVRRVVVPEGLRLEEIAQVMEDAEVVTAADFTAALDPPLYDFAFLKQLPRGQGLEGYLFPATYTFEKGVDAETVVRAMLQAFDDNVPQELVDAAKANGLSLHEMVTLASIIEREAQVPRERPIIASVYLNRIENGMRLQADPTTQYAVAEADPEGVAEFGWWKQELTVDDLAIKSPYNTYTSDGLPPGPIAAPGLASLEAASEPAETNYLFFVACGGEGEHAFGATLADHEANIARCQPG